MMSAVLVVLVMQIGVSFFILTERKGLGMFQLRQGPNKASFKALGQPVADGVKLFIKQLSFPFSASLAGYLLGPALLFFLACLSWLAFPSVEGSVRLEWGMLYVLCVSSLHVFGVFICGYSCDSRYGMLGAMRGVAQAISYEVVMSGVAFCPLMLVGSFDLAECRQSEMINAIAAFEALVVWVIVMLAETNRTPFDFVEGESELVAGYSVEYGGGAFAMIALAEYGSMFFMSVLSSVLFFSGLGLAGGAYIFSNLWYSFMAVCFCFFFIVVRGGLPRFRYDLLMSFCWLCLLPLTLGFMAFYACIG
uniref:NADH dehydrogenase subunit 1 n=1 Tax=Bankia setacea TaxID=693219 RepID=UPI0020282A96|nr:NADH dehydrogenase subunit 1 [Bankia setacea]UPX89073.1 NADH dehydrogenase subunit 1 [Bankia setacea]UPX89085.1 NADH dehydrogenase subunit 1 [Bankia setacea]UPX89097.1 NADH dehydrogenase subunit 1 [Bankia setacea]UPX89109.1 NADH dehydrogenase subunit 1 [Bankia setacea]UPX89121.1 NADH dehydrogenase subunit 1 [Bankia setacea]